MYAMKYFLEEDDKISFPATLHAISWQVCSLKIWSGTYKYLYEGDITRDIVTIPI